MKLKYSLIIIGRMRILILIFIMFFCANCTDDENIYPNPNLIKQIETNQQLSRKIVKLDSEILKLQKFNKHRKIQNEIIPEKEQTHKIARLKLLKKRAVWAQGAAKREKVILKKQLEQNSSFLNDFSIKDKEDKFKEIDHYQQKTIKELIKHEMELFSMAFIAKQENIDFEKQKVLEAKQKLIDELKLQAKQKNILEEKKINVKPISTLTTKTSKGQKYLRHIIGLGLSSGPNLEQGFSLQGAYSYRIHKLFSVGIQANLFLEEIRIDVGKSLFVGVKTDFHILPLFIENDKFDVYAGAKWGSLYQDQNFTFNSYNIFHLGACYSFTRHLGVFSEIGNVSSVGLRLSF